MSLRSHTPICCSPNSPFYHYKAAFRLFDRGGSIEHGQLLHYAVRREHPDYLEVLQLILDKGCPQINQVMCENCRQSYELQKAFGMGTPLHEAAALGKLDVVTVLLAKGADPAIEDPRGETALDRAERSNRTVVVECLRSLS